MAWIEQLQSANWFQMTGCLLGAYALGCFATGYYLVRLRTGRDIRDIQSGSTGARNVGRLLGWSGFALTVFGDFAKGGLAVAIARQWTHAPRLAALAMLAVVAGHIWPAQLRFRGGKGVATSLGALLFLDFRLALVFAGFFLAGLVVARRSVLPALFAFAGLPFAALWFAYDRPTVALIALLAAVVGFAHRKNFSEEIVLLLPRRAAGTESPKL